MPVGDIKLPKLGDMGVLAALELNDWVLGEKSRELGPSTGVGDGDGLVEPSGDAKRY